MKRRNFNILSGSTILTSIGIGSPKFARAGVPESAASALKTTLTPLGAERAGNADGSIPAWTGGITQVQPGWTPDQQQPDYFASDARLLTIDKSNVSQYADMLSVGIVNMINKYEGFNVQVYPTHRSASAPQWVYDNTYQNALKSSLDPRGGAYGFEGAYGGPAFPILDPDPNIAGIQTIWNHLTRWDGTYQDGVEYTFVAANGSVSLASAAPLLAYYPYYDPNGTVEKYNGWYVYNAVNDLAPPVIVGEAAIEWQSTRPLDLPTQAWELLNGQGRVRKAPEFTYDTPQSTGGGVSNYDESYGFYGSPDRYNWKYLGKKEMFIPYNNNKLFPSDPYKVVGAQYVDPDVVRFEKHRVHVIEANLVPGKRHSIPRKVIYIGEDTWHVAYADEYDAHGDFLKTIVVFNILVPNLPGVIMGNQAYYNLQNDEYEMGAGLFTSAQYPGYSFAPVNLHQFNPQSMAASSQY